MSYLKETPLGRSSEYVDEYMPSLLCPVPRWDARESLELEDTTLPFHGTDIWNAYELSWLNEKGKPLVAMCELRVPCTTPNIVESKSLKLYLNSFANTRFESRDAVRAAIEKDVAHTVGGDIEVPTIDGGRSRVKIPEGSQSGRQMRLRGKGMPALRGGGHGDMYIELAVETPVNLTSKQKELLREFEKLSEENNPESSTFFSKVKSFWDGMKN